MFIVLEIFLVTRSYQRLPKLVAGLPGWAGVPKKTPVQAIVRPAPATVAVSPANTAMKKTRIRLCIVTRLTTPIECCG